MRADTHTPPPIGACQQNFNSLPITHTHAYTITLHTFIYTERQIDKDRETDRERERARATSLARADRQTDGRTDNRNSHYLHSAKKDRVRATKVVCVVCCDGFCADGVSRPRGGLYPAELGGLLWRYVSESL